jgi:hypothetical protein
MRSSRHFDPTLITDRRFAGPCLVEFVMGRLTASRNI